MDDITEKNKAIHDNLLCDLSTGFFGTSRRVAGNLDRWNVFYARHYRLPAHQGESVLDDLIELENNFVIGIGKYDFLLEIFEKVDRLAIPVINRALDSIRQNNEMKRNEQREPKFGDTDPYTAKITVKAYNRDIEMHNDIAEILNKLVNYPESVLSSPIRNETNNGLDKNNPNPSSRRNVESLLERFVKKNKQSKEMSTCIWEESLGLFRAMKICHGAGSCHIYSEDGCVVISVEFGTKEDKKRACNDDESKLKNKVKYTFKIFFTVASLRRPGINVRIIDS